MPPVTRVTLANDAEDTAVQANIPRNGRPVAIKQKFQALGDPIIANRANIVSGGGQCTIFKDPNQKQEVAEIFDNGEDVEFNPVNLDNGVIVCM